MLKSWKTDNIHERKCPNWYLGNHLCLCAFVTDIWYQLAQFNQLGFKVRGAKVLPYSALQAQLYSGACSDYFRLFVPGETAMAFKVRLAWSPLLFRACVYPPFNSVFLHNILYFMSVYSRLRGRRFSHWRRVWRTSFLGRAKWSTWFAPWSRRRQLSRRPLNACAHAFPLTLRQMWRWPRSKRVPTGKPKLQPRSPDGSRGLAALPCRADSEAMSFTLAIGNPRPLLSVQMLQHFFSNVWCLN